MNRTSIAEISDERDSKFLGLKWEIFIDRIGIKERLGWMFSSTVTCIDDRYPRVSSNLGRVSLFTRSDSDDIGISSDDPRRIFEPLPLGDT